MSITLNSEQETFAERLLWRIVANLIATGSFQTYDDLQFGLRGLPLEEYIILDRANDDGIEIVRVANGRQDLPSLFDYLR
jgi:hypothetical protein